MHGTTDGSVRTLELQFIKTQVPPAQPSPPEEQRASEKALEGVQAFHAIPHWREAATISCSDPRALNGAGLTREKWLITEKVFV